MQPFESTCRVIQAVRDELKTCWPVLSSKLLENVSLRSKPSQIMLYTSSGSSLMLKMLMSSLMLFHLSMLFKLLMML